MIIEHIFFHNIIILPSVTKQYGPLAEQEIEVLRKSPILRTNVRINKKASFNVRK
jgi:hypothetical protein